MNIKNIIVTGLASTALVAMAAAPALACHKPETKKPVEHKVSVCHPTGSKTNPYVLVTVDKHAKIAGDIEAKSAADCPKPVVKTTPSPTPVAEAPGKGGTGGKALSSAVTTQMPAELPKTGSSAGLSALLGLPAMAIAGRTYLRTRAGK